MATMNATAKLLSTCTITVDQASPLTRRRVASPHAQRRISNRYENISIFLGIYQEHNNHLTFYPIARISYFLPDRSNILLSTRSFEYLTFDPIVRKHFESGSCVLFLMHPIRRSQLRKQM